MCCRVRLVVVVVVVPAGVVSVAMVVSVSDGGLEVGSSFGRGLLCGAKTCRANADFDTRSDGKDR